MVCRQVETQAPATCVKTLPVLLHNLQSPGEMKVRLSMLIQDGRKWLKSLGSPIHTSIQQHFTVQQSCQRGDIMHKTVTKLYAEASLYHWQ